MAEPTVPTISAEKLCGLTGLTDRRHRQLAKAGYFPPPSGGLYQLTPTISGMFKYYREQNAKKSDSLATKRERNLDLKNSVLEKDDALKKIELQEASRQLLPANHVASIITKLSAIVTSSVDFALLSRLPQMNAGLDAAQQRANNEPECNEIRRRIKDESLKFLKGLEKA